MRKGQPNSPTTPYLPFPNLGLPLKGLRLLCSVTSGPVHSPNHFQVAMGQCGTCQARPQYLSVARRSPMSVFSRLPMLLLCSPIKIPRRVVGRPPMQSTFTHQHCGDAKPPEQPYARRQPVCDRAKETQHRQPQAYKKASMHPLKSETTPPKGCMRFGFSCSRVIHPPQPPDHTLCQPRRRYDKKEHKKSPQ